MKAKLTTQSSAPWKRVHVLLTESAYTLNQN
jgi:hypothetical protein